MFFVHLCEYKFVFKYLFAMIHIRGSRQSQGLLFLNLIDCMVELLLLVSMVTEVMKFSGNIHWQSGDYLGV